MSPHDMSDKCCITTYGVGIILGLQGDSFTMLQVRAKSRSIFGRLREVVCCSENSAVLNYQLH
jgi:hypothetical protein